MNRILLLEDDPGLTEGLSYALSKNGFFPDIAGSVQEARSLLFPIHSYDLLLLDVTLPDGSGYDVCTQIKKQGDLPVIFLTAYDDEVNVIMGLELGADDYISKPFRVKELLARIKTVLRRYNKDTADGMINIGNIRINTNEAKVYKDSKEVILTAMEYRLLLIFINNRGIVLSRQKLLEDIWDVAGDFVNDNTLTVYIKRLRDKIEEDPASPNIIKTVRGLGYILEK